MEKTKQKNTMVKSRKHLGEMKKILRNNRITNENIE